MLPVGFVCFVVAILNIAIGTGTIPVRLLRVHSRLQNRVVDTGIAILLSVAVLNVWYNTTGLGYTSSRYYR